MKPHPPYALRKDRSRFLGRSLSSRSEQILAIAKESEVPEVRPEAALEDALIDIENRGTKAFCTPRDACSDSQQQTIDIGDKQPDDASTFLCLGNQKVFWACSITQCIGVVQSPQGTFGFLRKTWAKNIGVPIAIDANTDQEVFAICSDVDDSLFHMDPMREHFSLHRESKGKLIMVRQNSQVCVLLSRLVAPRAVGVCPRTGNLHVLDFSSPTSDVMHILMIPGYRIRQALPGHNPYFRKYISVVQGNIESTAIAMRVLDDGRVMIAHHRGKLQVFDFVKRSIDLSFDSHMSRLDPGCLQKLPYKKTLFPTWENHSGVVLSSVHDTKLGASACAILLQNITFNDRTGDPLNLGNECACIQGPWRLEINNLPTRALCVLPDKTRFQGLLLQRDGTVASTQIYCPDSVEEPLHITESEIECMRDISSDKPSEEIESETTTIQNLEGTSPSSTRPKRERSGPFHVIVRVESRCPPQAHANAHLTSNERVVVNEGGRFNFEKKLLRPHKDGSARTFNKFTQHFLGKILSPHIGFICIGSSAMAEKSFEVALQIAGLVLSAAFEQLVCVNLKVESLRESDGSWYEETFTCDDPIDVQNIQAYVRGSGSSDVLRKYSIGYGKRHFEIYELCSEVAETTAMSWIDTVITGRSNSMASESCVSMSIRNALANILTGSMPVALLASIQVCESKSRLDAILSHVAMAAQIPWKQPFEARRRSSNHEFAKNAQDNGAFTSSQRPKTASVPVRGHQATRRLPSPSGKLERKTLNLEALVWLQEAWFRNEDRTKLVLRAVFALHDVTAQGWLNGIHIVRLVSHWLQYKVVFFDEVGKNHLHILNRFPERYKLYLHEWEQFMFWFAKVNPEKLLAVVQGTTWLHQSLALEPDMEERASTYRAIERERIQGVDRMHSFWKFVHRERV